MDHRPIVNRRDGSSRDPVSVDQAIFTSIRTRTGEGYRIIAAGPGIGAEEKAEITRRAPSHASLCDERPDAVGLLAFPLATGRTCVAICRYAGEEHTARGGYRVHSHFAVLDVAAFERFVCDPTRVHGALLAAVDSEPILKSEPHLEKLTLDPRAMGSASSRARDVGPCNVGAVLSLVLAMFEGEQIVALAEGDEMELLRSVLRALPLSIRRELGVSIGLQCSPMRQLQLAFVHGNQDAMKRSMRGLALRFFDARNAAPPPNSEFDAWLVFLRRQLSSGRMNEIEEMANAISEDVSADRLAAIVSLSDAIERVATADQASLAELTASRAGLIPTEEPEASLLQRLKSAADERARRLKESAAARVCSTVGESKAAG